jgi:hypothetical protein
MTCNFFEVRAIKISMKQERILDNTEATFFLNVLGSNHDLLLFTFISSILYIYKSLYIFCLIRIVMDIRNQDPLLNFLSEISIML